MNSWQIRLNSNCIRKLLTIFLWPSIYSCRFFGASQMFCTYSKHPDCIRGGGPIESWWRHQMEAFSALLAICAGNSSVTGEFPSQRPVTRSFDVFFDLRLNKQLSKQSWGWWFETPSRSLWRHCNGDIRSVFLLQSEYSRSILTSNRIFKEQPNNIRIILITFKVQSMRVGVKKSTIYKNIIWIIRICFEYTRNDSCTVQLYLIQFETFAFSLVLRFWLILSIRYKRRLDWKWYKAHLFRGGPDHGLNPECFLILILEGP